MDKNKNNSSFKFSNDSGVSNEIITVLVVCVLVASAITGYMLFLSLNATSEASLLQITDAVRPGVIRATK